MAGHQDIAHLEVAGRNHGSVASRIAEPDDAVANTMKASIDRLK